MGDKDLRVTDEFVDINDYDPNSLEKAMQAGQDPEIVGEETTVLDASSITGRVQTRRIEVSDLESTKTGQRITHGAAYGMVNSPMYDGTAALKAADAREMFRTPPHALEAVCESVPDSMLPSYEPASPADDTAYMGHSSDANEADAMFSDPPVRILKKDTTRFAKFDY